MNPDPSLEEIGNAVTQIASQIVADLGQKMGLALCIKRLGDTLLHTAQFAQLSNDDLMNEQFFTLSVMVEILSYDRVA